jgi:peptidyl-dipeptidase Dcp
MQNQTPGRDGGNDNPFFETWTGAFEGPPFGRIAPEHFMPAFERAFAEHDAEIEAVASQADAPTFGNTIEALERGGKLLDRVSGVFFNLASADTNDALLEIEREIGPLLAAHSNRILQNDRLFQRIDALHRARETLGLTAEQRRVLDRYHTMYRRGGAGLDPAVKDRLAKIAKRSATLGTTFSQNVLADEQAYTLTLESEDDLAGLPDFVRAAARAAAAERDMPGKHVITLSRSSVEPFLQFSSRRDLREKAFRAWIARGEQGATDNKAVIAEMVALRAERAKLLGYETFAHYRLDDAMAKTPAAVRDLLDRVWAPARASALADRDAMQELVREEGGNFKIEPWDWRYYAEKLRRVRCDIDEATVKPYFQLHHIIDAAFYTAYKLFGLSFERRKDIAAWHPDVMTWEVKDADGRHLGLFFGDYFARQSKRSGAWMTTLRDQEKLTGPDVRPLVINVMNFNKGSDGAPTLLSFDDARTLFHEFGHGLHGLLSDVTYPMVAGTSVLTDWVELPSQLYEHWLEQPDILRRFAVHARTGRAIPDDLLQRLIAARNFNRGFATVEFVSSALFDLDTHLLTETKDFDVGAFEQASLAKMGMPAEIVMRHRPTHFAHVFSGGGYASAYYSYMWSEVLDADAFAAFEETGDIFDPAMAKKLYDHVYSAGGKSDPEALYTAFRGRLPTADALLKQRGFAPA